LVGVGGELFWGVEGCGVKWFVVEFCSWWVVGDSRDRCRLNVCMRGRVTHRSHGVELKDDDVGDVDGLAVVVGEVDVDVEIVVVLGVVGVYAGDVVIFDNYGVVRR
jgi:hypothetical protein